MPATFAGGSEEAWQEVAREEVRPSEADEPCAQREVRLEVSREVQLSAPAETQREVRLQRLRMAEGLEGAAAEMGSWTLPNPAVAG